MITPAAADRLTVTTIRQRPDLLPVVAGWLWTEWWRKEGHTLEQTQALFADCIAEVGAPQTLVLLEGGTPIGTVTLARFDLDERPDLTPWLAGVFVVPGKRGQGHVRPLLAAFETTCRAAGIEVAWLYTNTAERVYLRAGWELSEVIERPGKLPVSLMRRDLTSKV